VSENVRLAEKHSLTQIVENFRSKVRGIDIAIDIAHDPDRGAAGWIRDLKVAPSSSDPNRLALWAKPEWTDLGKQVVGSVYRYVSAEIGRHVDPETGKATDNVLFAVSLTNRPYVKGLKPVSLDDEWIEVLREGDYIHPEYGEIRIRASEVPILRRILSWVLRKSTVADEHEYEHGEAQMAEPMRTDDGVQYPARAYLYVPDPTKPSTWKLRIMEYVNGKLMITRAQLGRAAAALSPGGFRGRRVELPPEEEKKVKRKLVELYRQLGVPDEEIPQHLFEAEEEREEVSVKTLQTLLKEKGIPVGEDAVQSLERWMEGQEQVIRALQESLNEAEAQAKELSEKAKALEARVAELEKALAEKERETFLAEMVRQAKIAPADLEKWRKRYDENPNLVREILLEAKPVVDLGTEGSDSAQEPDTLEERRATKLAELLKEGVPPEEAYVRVMREIQ